MGVLRHSLSIRLYHKGGTRGEALSPGRRTVHESYHRIGTETVGGDEEEEGREEKKEEKRREK